MNSPSGIVHVLFGYRTYAYIPTLWPIPKRSSDQVNSLTMRNIILILCLTFSLKAFPQAIDSLIVLGKRQSIYSELLGEKREYWIYLPPSYNLPDSKSHRYPVLYLLD